MSNRKKKINSEDIPASLILEFIAIRIFTKVMHFLTRFYPLSLCLRDRKYHYCNRHLVAMKIRLERAFRKFGSYIYVYFVEEDEFFYEFNTRLLNRKQVRNEGFIRKIRKKLKLANPDIFIRENGPKEIQILVAKEVFWLKRMLT